MRKHIKRVGGGLGATVVFGTILLVTDIPKALEQADKSFAFIAKSLGASKPPEHFVSTAWGHPWVVVLVFVIVFAVGVLLSWGIESGLAKLAGKLPAIPRDPDGVPAAESTAPPYVSPFVRGIMSSQEMRRSGAAGVDPENDALVDKVRRFSDGYLKPAMDAAHEAQRLSAYVFKDTWGETPAGKWGYTGILHSASYNPSPLQVLVSSPPRDVDNTQRMLLGVLETYAIKTHRLCEVLRDFQEKNRLEDMHGFFDALRAWWRAHQDLLASYATLQRTIGLPIVRDYKFDQHVAAPKNYGLGEVEEILNG